MTTAGSSVDDYALHTGLMQTHSLNMHEYGDASISDFTKKKLEVQVPLLERGAAE